LKKLVMLAREARWWRRSLLNRLEICPPDPILRLAKVAAAPIWHLLRVAQVTLQSRNRKNHMSARLCVVAEVELSTSPANAHRVARVAQAD
jgi:hypothetical protein